MKKAYICFITGKYRSEYEEIPFEEFLHLQETDPAFQQKHFLLLNGVLLEVPWMYIRISTNNDDARNIFRKRRFVTRRFLITHWILTNGRAKVFWRTRMRTLRMKPSSHVMRENLRAALHSLPPDEMALIDALYFREKSEREWSEETGIPQKTINNRKRSILAKLLNLLENRK